MKEVADAAGVDVKTAEVLTDYLRMEAELSVASPRFSAFRDIEMSLADIGEDTIRALLPGYVDGSFAADPENGIYSGRVKLDDGSERTIAYRIGDISSLHEDSLRRMAGADSNFGKSFDARHAKLGDGVTWASLSDAQRYAAAAEADEASFAASWNSRETGTKWEALDETTRMAYKLAAMNAFSSGERGVFELTGADGEVVHVNADDVINLANGRLADIGYGASATQGTVRHETFHALWRFARATMKDEDVQALAKTFGIDVAKDGWEAELDETMAPQMERYASGHYVSHAVSERFDRLMNGWAGKFLGFIGRLGPQDEVTDPDGKPYRMKGLYDAILRGKLGSGTLGVELRKVKSGGVKSGGVGSGGVESGGDNSPTPNSPTPNSSRMPVEVTDADRAEADEELRGEAGKDGSSSAPAVNKNLRSDVAAALNTDSASGKVLRRRSIVEFSDVPALLAGLGVPADARIISRADILRKINTEHHLDADAIAALPGRYAAPVAVFRDGANFVILTDLQAEANDGTMKPVMVYLEAATENGRRNFIASAYSRDADKESAYVQWANAGNLLYLDGKKAASCGLEDGTASQLRPRAQSGLPSSSVPQTSAEVKATAENPADAATPNQRYYRVGLPNSPVKLVGRLEVRDVETGVITSTDEDYHDRGNQNRDDKSEESRALVEKIGANPDPLQIGTVQPMANNGIVWMLPNGDVIIGNHRVNGVRVGYEKGTAAALEKFVREDATKRGIEIGADVKKPLMVFVLERIESPDGKADVHEVVRLANESQNRGFNVREQAGNDAKILADNNLLPRMEFRADGRIDETKSGDAIGKFRQESGAQGLVAEDGSLTEEGQTRLTNAALAVLLGGEGNSALLNRIMTNAGRLDMTGELRALMKMTPELMSLAEAKPAYDLRGPLVEALQLFTEWRDKDETLRSEKGKTRHDWRERAKDGHRLRGLSWEMFMSQGDMFRQPSEEAKILGDLFAKAEELRSFDREDVESAAGKKRVIDLVSGYLTDYIANARAANTETEDMFGGSPASRADIMSAQRGKGGEGGGARFSVDAVEALRQYDEVVARYTNEDGTKKRGWMKAPNGKPTRLSERQWVQVRTPAFKAWFGDWEAAELQKWLEGEPVAQATGKEYEGMSRKEIVNAVFENWERVGHSVTNPEVGEVELSRSGIHDSMAHGIGRNKLAAFDFVPEIIANGRVVRFRENWEGRGYDSHIIAAPISIGGKPCIALAVVNKSKSGNRFYLHEVGVIEEIKKYAEVLRTGSSDEKSALSRNLGDVESIALSLFADKGASKIVDENGEPLVVYRGATFDPLAQKPGDGVIKPEAYFTADPEYAKRYTGTGGKVRAYYLDIRNPFDVRRPECLADLQKVYPDHNFERGRFGALDWAEASTVDGEFLRDNFGDKYDGIIYDEGGDPGESGVSYRGISYVPIKGGKRVKSATDNNGDFSENPDVRYSIGGIYTGTAADYANRSRQGGVDDGPSLLMIGTGEGSQVYGWGLYGSTVRGVAEGYATLNSGAYLKNGKPISDYFERTVAEALDDYGWDVAKTISGLQEKNKTLGTAARKENNAIIRELRAHGEEYRRKSGSIYEQTFFTDRAPGDESHLLKWYEPVSEEQLKWIRDALVKEKNIRDYSKTGYGNVLVAFEHYLNVYSLEGDTRGITGETVYKAIDNVVDKDPQAASEFLARAGIDGVKYPVDSYGGKGVKDGDEAGWNYVSFRDDNIRVDHKWTDGQMRYSIAQTPTGEKFVLLDRPNKIDWNDRDKVREYLTTLVGTGAVSLADNQRIEIGKELPDEYTRSRYAEKAFRNVRLRKVRGKTAQHLDELIAVSGERTAEPSKHKKREGGVYYRRAVNFGVLGHEVKRGYSAELISYEENGKEYLYDLVNIKDNPSLVPDSATGGNGGFESLSTYNGEGSTPRSIAQTGAPAQWGAGDSARPLAGGGRHSVSAPLVAAMQERQNLRAAQTEAQRVLSRVGGTEIGHYINAEFRREGRVALIGKRISSARDLAAFAQIYRNPCFETFRYFFTKNGGVVWQTGVTARLPGATNVSVNTPKENTYAEIERMAAKLKPDGVWLLHNHPSGNVAPSRQDIDTTGELREYFDRLGIALGGHVIIDHDTYAELDKWGNYRPRRISADELDASYHGDPYTNRLRDRGEPFNLGTVAAYAMNLQRDVSRPGKVLTLISIDSKGEFVTAVANVPSESVADGDNIGSRFKQLDGFFADWRSASGGAHLVVVGDQDVGKYPASVQRVLRRQIEIGNATDFLFSDSGNWDSVMHRGGVKPRSIETNRLIMSRTETFDDGQMRYSVSIVKPWAKDFPRATLMTTRAALMAKHADLFNKAKAGDGNAAMDLIDALMSDDKRRDKVLQLKKDHPNAAIACPVHAEEASGRNAIPFMFAQYIADTLGMEVADTIAQTVKAGHTGSDAWYRLTHRAQFEGEVEDGKEYILVDDHITQGGTINELRGYIENNGGKVVAVAALTASRGSAILSPSKEVIDELKARYPDIDQLLRDGDIAGSVEAVTNSEAEYIKSFRPEEFRRRIADTVRNLSADEQGGTRGDTLRAQTVPSDAGRDRGLATRPEAAARAGEEPLGASASEGGRYSVEAPPRRQLAYPQLRSMSDDELLSAAVAVRMALGESEKFSDKVVKINTVQKMMRRLHPDWDTSQVGLETNRVLSGARELGRRIREDIDRGVSESLVLRHLPDTVCGQFGAEMRDETRRGQRLGRFGQRVASELEERQRRLVEDAVRVQTGLDAGAIENAFGINLSETIMHLAENPLKERPPEGAGEGGEGADGQADFGKEAAPAEIDAKVKAVVEDILKASMEEASRDARNRADRWAAAGRDAENEKEMGGESQDDEGSVPADSSAGDGDALAAAVAKEGLELENPRHLARFVAELARRQWIQEHHLAKDADVWRDLVAVQFLRKTAQSVYAKLCRDLVYSRSRETAMQRIAKLDAVPTVAGLLSEMEFVGALVNAQRIRDTQKAMCEKLDLFLRQKFGAQGRFKPDKEEGQRSVSAEAELRARYMRHAMWLTPDAAAEEARQLQETLDALSVDFQDAGRDRDQSREFVETIRKLNVLREFGALRYKPVGEIEAAAKWWEDFARGESDDIVREMSDRDIRTKKAAHLLAAAFADPSRTTVREGGKEDALSRFVTGHMGFISLLQDCMRHASDADAAAVKDIIDYISREIQKSGDRSEAEKRRHNDAFHAAVESIYGKKFNAVMKEMTAQDDRFAKYMGVVGGKRVTPTKGRALQLLVSLLQEGRKIEVEDEENPGQTKTVWEGGYHDNIVKHKRGGQAAEIMRLLAPQDMNMLKWLGQWYESNRSDLSQVCRSLFGIGVYAELPNYFPVKMLLETQGLEKGQGVGWTIFPKALTPRVRNERDFDTSADIFSMWASRMEEAAQWKHHAQLGLEMRGIFGRAELREAVRANHGASVDDLMQGFITDILAGHGAYDRSTAGVQYFSDQIRGWTALCALGGNIGVMFKQTTSIPAFGFEIGLVNTAKYIVSAFTPEGMSAIGKIWNSEQRRTRWQVGSSEAVRNALNQQNAGLLKRMLQKSMVTTKAGDVVPALVVGQGIYRDCLDRGMSEEDAMAETWSIIERTQQSGRMENQTSIQRRNKLGRIMFQFLSTQQQYLQYEVRAIREVMARPDSVKRWGSLGRAILLNHFILSSAYYWVGQLYKYALGQEPPEDELKDWLITCLLGPYGSLFVAGFCCKYTLERAFKGYSIKGGSSMLPMESWLKTQVNDGAKLLEAIFDSDGDTWDNMLEAAGRWMSDSNSVVRDLRKIYRYRIKGESPKRR